MISVGKKWRRSENAEGKQREFHQMKRESSLKRDLKKNCSNSARDINYYKNKYAICVSVHNPTDCLCFHH